MAINRESLKNVADTQDLEETVQSPRPARKTKTGHSASLTRNQSVVLEALKAADKPIKAYDLLEKVKAKGVRAPMTVYRALDDLIEKGLVYKLESTKCYSACLLEESEFPIFLICENCGSSQLVHDTALEQALRGLASRKQYSTERLRVEITSHCCGD